MAKKMTKAQRELILSILGDHNIMSLATVRPDGYPQATTVSYVNDGLAIYFGAPMTSQKAENIRNSPKVSATIDHDQPDWTQIYGISLGGHASVVEKRSEYDHIVGLMRKKYPQIEKMDVVNFKNVALFRIDPEVISLLDYTKGFGHSTLVKP